MQVIKRDGSIQEYNPEKIIVAVTKAYKECNKDLNEEVISDVLAMIHNEPSPIHIEKIQDMIEDEIMACRDFEVAKAYIKYRFLHKIKRDFINTTDESMQELLDGESDY